MTDREAEDAVACVYCGAPRGAPCRDTRTGHLTRRPHASRLRAAHLEAVAEVPGGDEPEDRWDR